MLYATKVTTLQWNRSRQIILKRSKGQNLPNACNRSSSQAFLPVSAASLKTDCNLDYNTSQLRLAYGCYLDYDFGMWLVYNRLWLDNRMRTLSILSPSVMQCRVLRRTNATTMIATICSSVILLPQYWRGTTSYVPKAYVGLCTEATTMIDITIYIRVLRN